MKHPCGESECVFLAVCQMVQEREQLPVKRFQEEIMGAIHRSPVVIIRGATGCGKTTQVPQYILDQYIHGGKASECNIVVTQVSSRGTNLKCSKI